MWWSGSEGGRGGAHTCTHERTHTHTHNMTHTHTKQPHTQTPAHTTRTHSSHTHTNNITHTTSTTNSHAHTHKHTHTRTHVNTYKQPHTHRHPHTHTHTAHTHTQALYPVCELQPLPLCVTHTDKKSIDRPFRKRSVPENGGVTCEFRSPRVNLHRTFRPSISLSHGAASKWDQNPSYTVCI